MLARLLADTPTLVLLLAFMAIGVGIVLLVSWLFYDRFIAMAQESPTPEEDSEEDGAPAAPVIPRTYDLRSRVLAFTTLAFVFMLAFVLNTFWGDVQGAQSATQSEASHLAQLSTLAQRIEDPQRSDAVQAAILSYTDTIVNEQWPLLEVADSDAASAVAIEATSALSAAVFAAREGDESSPPAVWDEIQATMSELSQDSVDRLRELPASTAAWRVGIVIVLGFTMLITTAAFLPTRKRAYLAGLVIMAALTSLLIFAMVQASNPYAKNITPEPLIKAVQLSAP